MRASFKEYIMNITVFFFTRVHCVLYFNLLEKKRDEITARNIWKVDIHADVTRFGFVEKIKYKDKFYISDRSELEIFRFFNHTACQTA